MIAAELAPGVQFSVTNRTTLFELPPMLRIDQFHRTFELSPDGRSFLFLARHSTAFRQATDDRLILVEHWFGELRERLRP